MNIKRPTRHTIESVRSFFNEHAPGYVLISTAYVGSGAVLEIQCPALHRCDKTFDSFRKGTRCARCVGNIRYSIDQVRDKLAMERYILLSSTYVNAHTVLEIECPAGHRCDKTFSSFQSGGNRCKTCSRNDKYTIEQVREILAVDTYILISTIYHNVGTILEMQCPAGHRCDKTFSNFFHRGARCAICAGNYKYTVDQVRAILGTEGYILLSTRYDNSATILEIQCQNGHRCDKRLNNFQSGNRCAICVGINIPYTIDQVRAIVEVDGYTLLSTTYYNVHAVLEIQSPTGHRCDKSFAKWHNGGQRCHICVKYRTENVVREIFESIYQKPFPTIRNLDWNRNPETSVFLELDGYCEELRFAWEYHGFQHYEYVGFFHNGDIENFHAQQRRDMARDANCVANQVTPIVIPYWFGDYRDPTKLRENICKDLQGRGLLPEGFTWLRQTTLLE